MKKALARDLLLAPLLALLACLVLFLVISLASCSTTVDTPEFQKPRRDWSTFEVPPVGTPLMLRAFNLTGPREFETVDIIGKWDDGKPFLISFPITRTLDKVVRIEIHYRGEVLAARSFRPPTTLTAGTIAGYRK